MLQRIEEAAEKGELDELVLMIIWNRLDLARRDVRRYIYSLSPAFQFLFLPNQTCVVLYCVLLQDEKDAIRSLDLLYRRVEVCFSVFLYKILL